MKRKEHISAPSYRKLFDYLARFELIDDARFEQQLKEFLVGLWCDSGEEVLHHEGEICKKAWFISKGMVYLYFPDPQRDNAVIFMIYREGEIAFIPDSFMNGNPSTCYVVACMDTELLEITKKQVELLHILFPQFLKLQIGILAAIVEKANERHVLHCLEPETRIRTFFEQYPELLPTKKTVKMRDKHIASYLRIDTSHYCKYKNKIF